MSQSNANKESQIGSPTLFGKELRFTRAEYGGSLKRWGDAMGYHVSWMSRLERGRVPVPSTKRIDALAKLGVDDIDIDYLRLCAGYLPKAFEEIMQFANGDPNPRAARRFAVGAIRELLGNTPRIGHIEVFGNWLKNSRS